MAEVLLYNIHPSKEAKIKMICRTLNIRSRTVAPEEYGYKLSYLLGLSDDSSCAKDTEFDGEMLYLADIGGMLDILLSQLRRQKVPVTLKAVKTDTNVGFTSCELYRELSAEHEAIARGRFAHTTE